ncbi:hypothetical protein R3P38DRAFT_2718905, partial [Favolaschia claudopus]
EGSLSPSRLLYLARKFRVHQWVQSCGETLIPVCGSLDNDEALALGPITLNIITRAKAEIDKERIGTAFTPGKLKNVKPLCFGECSDHKQCERVWKETWWNVIAKRVSHPTHP